MIPTRPVHHLPWGWTPAESRLSQLDPSSWPGQGPAWWLSSSDLAPSHASGSSWAEWERGWSLTAGPGLSPPGGVEGHWDGGQVIPKTQNEKKTRAGAAPSADWGGGVNPDLPLPFFSLGEQSQMGHAHMTVRTPKTAQVHSHAGQCPPLMLYIHSLWVAGASAAPEHPGARHPGGTARRARRTPGKLPMAASPGPQPGQVRPGVEALC